MIMSKTVKRRISVDGAQYVWVLDGNSINRPNDTHIRVHKEGTTGNILYIDPYNWHFEIRPKFIAEAIRFALNAGWEDRTKATGIYVAYFDDEFQVLPKGVKFRYQINKDADA